MKRYSVENPSFFKSVDETITRNQQPYQLELSEISQDELIYKEIIQNQFLDKRTLGPQVYPYRIYVFNQNSLLINYFLMNGKTRMLWLFRRLNLCKHKHSCAESAFRKLFEVLSFYSLIRVPLRYIVGALSQEGENIMDSKYIIGAEIASLFVIGGLRSAGCMVRFMKEEIIQQS
ncbi:UNKNOWN [Stylonychia lemnae]|uniref:Uncharacterized protein n=1 Tax=Stylonychia lemnae TaxID=5949 RepID=A0A078B982_STYLE|nr:UNKNOWN [Stylonychia lemnae]|eukprot:CDW90939.1 UNKNOWN [Stylonychia lemnae]